ATSPSWRDPLLRRMLAVADAAAAALIILVFEISTTDLISIPVVAAFLPISLLLAKLQGLYDRDQRSLRHLTVDELPAIFMWSLTGTGIVSLLVLLVPHDSIHGTTALLAVVVGAGSAFVLRSAMRL